MFALSVEDIVEVIDPHRIVSGAGLPTGIKGVSIDTRTLSAGEMYVALIGKHYDGHRFIGDAVTAGAGLLVVSKVSRHGYPSVPTLVVDDTLRALAALASAVRSRCSSTVIGVTGSMGKTTTKEMIRHLLSGGQQVLSNPGTENNIIGVSKALLRMRVVHRVGVLELGTNHFGEIAELAGVIAPDAGIVTCIAPVHTEFLRDMDGVRREKISLFSACPDTQPILNGDDPMLAGLRTKVKPIWFGTKKEHAIRIRPRGMERSAVLFSVNGRYTLRLKTIGVFNGFNAAAALAAAHWHGMSVSAAVERLSSFRFPRMRLELIRRAGVTFVNDAYNANPAAAVGSLSAFATVAASRRLVVMADMRELGLDSALYHARIAEHIRAVTPSCVLLLGRDVKHTARALTAAGQTDVFLFDDKDVLKKKLHSLVKKGDAVLLKGSRAFALETLIPD
jgi:UDP-N-acetylmuramoyl-tripeptide--D-alanyl-D-alanine ligase